MNTGSLTLGKRGKSYIASKTLGDNENEAKQPSRPGNADAVDHSHAALLLTEALHTAQNAPDLRQERIDDLRARIANGTYEIDEVRLAARLLAEEPQLFQF